MSDFDVNVEDLLKQFNGIINSDNSVNGSTKHDSALPCETMTTEQRIELAIVFYHVLSSYSESWHRKLFTAWNVIGIQPEDALHLNLFLRFSPSDNRFQLPNNSFFSQDYLFAWGQNIRNRLIFLYDENFSTLEVDKALFEKLPGLGGNLLFAYFPTIGCYLAKYHGESQVMIEDEPLMDGRSYCFKPGSYITLSNGEQIRYDDITRLRL